MATKLKLHRMPVRKLPVAERVSSFEEVDQTYTLEEALAEAQRCLLCAKPHCVEGCPGHNNIPGFIEALRQGDLAGAMAILRRTTSFPDLCSRVCDKRHQCEGFCPLRHKGEPIAIGALERFLADWELAKGGREARVRAPSTGLKVAVVGSGPAGLACAGDLAQAGFTVTVFEAQPFLGGVLAWGVPLFRLPQALLDAQIDFLQRLGVEFRVNSRIGRDVTLDGLFSQGYKAVFLGLGAPVPKEVKMPGRELAGIYDAAHFLSGARLTLLEKLPAGRRPQVGRRVAVIGGGNTAMDIAQTAVRLGAAEVTVVYRRTEAEMPASADEVASAREEGVQFRFLAAPTRFLGNGAGRLRAMECQEMVLGEPDASGRRRPTPKPGSEFLLEVDTCILALGFDTDLEGLNQEPQLKVTPEGLIVADAQTGRTTYPGVWAGGDVVLGPDTVVRAMVHGKAAARDIASCLRPAERRGQPGQPECAPQAARTP